ncbi:MAG: thymidylate synthase [Dehalococcoidia bacterium]|jgi:thymidylate synthase
MKQYLDLLQNILDNGVEKESGRANMPNTIGISHGVVQMNLQDGFPLLTTKKMYWKGIVHELLWFLRGDTNIKYLVDNDVNIWNGDAYRWYLKYAELNGGETQNGILHDNEDGTYRVFSSDEFIQEIKDDNEGTYLSYKMGDLGKVYGHQWRNQNGVDQIKELIDGLKTNPYSRYHIIDGWNKADFKDMALPPCHLLYQFIVRPLSEKERIKLLEIDDTIINSDQEFSIEKMLDIAGIPKFYLDLNMYQRSCDTFLGVPFNVASMSILLMILAKVANMIPGVATWIGGDTHLYLDHIPMVKEQLKRTPHDLPELIINAELNTLDDILNLRIEDFKLSKYAYHPTIKAELFTGVKK